LVQVVLVLQGLEQRLIAVQIPYLALLPVQAAEVEVTLQTIQLEMDLLVDLAAAAHSLGHLQQAVLEILQAQAHLKEIMVATILPVRPMVLVAEAEQEEPVEMVVLLLEARLEQEVFLLFQAHL
jgi:hypothetical protein